MKRFHVHVHVDDLDRSVAFYSKLFAAAPARLEGDYAKWMLDDPRINFAISARGGKAGVDHLGFQVDDAAELDELKARAESADMALLDEGETTCCYARSEKHWVTDPQGIAWEHFHTLAGIPVFSEAARSAPSSADAASACCATAPTTAAQAGSSPAAVGQGAPMSAPMTAATGAAASAATGAVTAAAPGTGCCGPTVRGKPIGITVKPADKPAGSCC